MTNPFVENLLRACPGAESAWQKHLDFWKDESDRGVFNDIAAVVHYVVDAVIVGNFGPLDGVLAFVEQELAGADPDRIALSTVGVIEGLQVISSHTDGLTPRIAIRCGPRTTTVWAEVERAWEGVGSLADMIRRERKRDARQ